MLAARSFPEVSGLSRRQRSLPAVRHCFCCRAAVARPRAPLLVTVCARSPSLGLGGESELLIVGSCFGAPFKESEQLRSHESARGLDVETDQPRVWSGRCQGSPRSPGPRRALPGLSPRSRRAMRAADVHVGVPLGDGLALVVGLAALGQRQLDLGPAVLEVDARAGSSDRCSGSTRARSRSISWRCRSSLRLRVSLVAACAPGRRRRPRCEAVQPHLAAVDAGEGVARSGPCRRAATSPRCPRSTRPASIVSRIS